MGVPIPIGTGIFKLLHKPVHTASSNSCSGSGDGAVVDGVPAGEGTSSSAGSGNGSGVGSSSSGGGVSGVSGVSGRCGSLLQRRQRLLETI